MEEGKRSWSIQEIHRKLKNETAEDEKSRQKYSLALDFQFYEGERTEKQEIKEGVERRCQREFFKHNHDFTDIIIERNKSGKYNRCHNCNFGATDHQSIIGCLECKIYPHQNCATKGMQLNIRHIYHPFHRLTLKSYHSNDSLTRCNACNKKVYKGKFIFNCKSCNFHLCIQCSLRYPNIVDTVRHHHHLLTFFSDSTHKFVDEYCTYCKGRCDITDSIFRCVNCNFNIHLVCYPLTPHTIKHKCHVDPLILITDPDLVESDKGYDEFYCDVCEEERNPNQPVYCCNECLFVAHIKCVSSEVSSSIALHGSKLAVATTTMLEQSDILDKHYAGDIIEDQAKEIEIIEKPRSTEEKKEEDTTIQPVEYYLTSIIRDETMAREFFAKLKIEEINRENEESKNNVQELFDLKEKIDKLREGITKQTKIVKDLNEELEIVEAQREAVVRLQH